MSDAGQQIGSEDVHKAVKAELIGELHIGVLEQYQEAVGETYGVLRWMDGLMH